MIRQLDETTYVSGQIAPGDMAQLKTAGVGLIINNRPDGEDEGQPTGSEIEQAAVEAGLAYLFLPISRGIGPTDVQQMRQALNGADGKALAYCRSGTRSTLAWALARREQGASVEEIQAAATQVGVDLTPIAHLL